MSLNATQEAPVDVEADILLLSVLCDWDALAIRFELVLYNFAIGIVLHAEGVIKHAGDVIFSERGVRTEHIICSSLFQLIVLEPVQSLLQS